MKFSKQFMNYESEATLFLNQLKKDKPHLEEDQRAGRAIWWEKDPIDLDERERTNASKVKQQAYVYQNKVK